MNELGIDIPIPDGIEENEVSDGFHTFGELYDHRIANFLAVMSLAHAAGFECGWSRKHSDGELCFGGGWVIAWVISRSGLKAVYHMEDSRPLPASLERDLGDPWNGKEETMDALSEIAVTMEEEPDTVNCHWHRDDEGNWETDCGGMFIITEGGPNDNGMKCCCYCGSSLVEDQRKPDTVLALIGEK